MGSARVPSFYLGPEQDPASRPPLWEPDGPGLPEGPGTSNHLWLTVLALQIFLHHSRSGIPVASQSPTPCLQSHGVSVVKLPMSCLPEPLCPLAKEMQLPAPSPINPITDSHSVTVLPRLYSSFELPFKVDLFIFFQSTLRTY